MTTDAGNHMRLARLTLSGFRCFGTKTTLEVEDLTALVGANGVGKTGILLALVRMFGVTNAQRTLTKEDFYVPTSGTPSPELKLTLEAIFEFPELLDDKDATASTAIPECLRHITVKSGSAVPTCRILLNATWRATAAVEGDVEQELVWASSDAEVPADDDKHRLSALERSLIQVFYVPATRDAVRELRAVSGTMLSRALQRIAWSDPVREAVHKGATNVSDTLRSEAAMKQLEQLLQGHWRALSNHPGEPFFGLAQTDVPSVLRSLDARLKRDDGSEEALPLLSEGERSLMYFAMAQSALEFEQAAATPGTLAGATTPVLTILAVEEPENHLAPQYLARILRSLRGILATGRGQVLLTSHSASLMRRIEPTEIRHLRVEKPGVHRLSRITLPDARDEAFKYVREAVRAHPELYFAKAVVLCEGASEEVILPRVASAHGLDIDPRFVAVVPLGGRHVNHFWRLLKALQVPYVTLLDLDIERVGGAWGRIHYVMTQLIDLGVQKAEVLASLPEDQLDGLASKPSPASVDDDGLASYVDHLEKRFGVFFSAPLDVDFLMMRAFTSAYRKALPPGGRGPNIPKDEPKRSERFAAAVRAVLGAEGGDGDAYTVGMREEFPWYSYLFLGGSKPATHAAALAEIDDATLKASCPNILARLVERVKNQ
jgi:putative ATP-dependent endonuclease of OLD family